MLTINDTAKKVGLSKKQLRDYETLGLVTPHARSASGYRLYSSEDIERLSFIAHARNVGFSLAQTKTLLALQASPHQNSCHVKALTKTHIDELSEKIDKLITMRNKLQSWYDACSGDDHTECVILKALE
ncbi:MAG: MerR family DNA-binding protein [Moraxella sp.]|nr:MerR family DNA-binding protein [Moraxella sp.]